jgi:hypothetical protein
MSGALQGVRDCAVAGKIEFASNTKGAPGAPFVFSK